jgi:hypothetical protein
VVRRDQAVQCNNLKRRLRRGWFLQHHNNESKTPGLRQGFVSSLRRLFSKRDAFFMFEDLCEVLWHLSTYADRH